MFFEILVNVISGLGGLMVVRRRGTITVTMKKIIENLNQKKKKKKHGHNVFTTNLR